MRVLLILLFCFNLAVAAATTLLPDDIDQQRYHNLLEHLRCLVCQNQSLADSGAGLADDLRQQVIIMLQQGATDEQILTYMVERYGDFVLYEPPVTRKTLLLWFGPFLFAGLAVLALVVFLLRRGTAKLPQPGERQRQRIAELLSRQTADSKNND